MSKNLQFKSISFSLFSKEYNISWDALTIENAIRVFGYLSVLNKEEDVKAVGIIEELAQSIYILSLVCPDFGDAIAKEYRVPIKDLEGSYFVEAILRTPEFKKMPVKEVTSGKFHNIILAKRNFLSNDESILGYIAKDCINELCADIESSYKKYGFWNDEAEKVDLELLKDESNYPEEIVVEGYCGGLINVPITSATIGFRSRVDKTLFELMKDHPKELEKESPLGFFFNCIYHAIAIAEALDVGFKERFNVEKLKSCVLNKVIDFTADLHFCELIYRSWTSADFIKEISKLENDVTEGKKVIERKIEQQKAASRAKS